jgi:hypothetical protein
LDSPHQQLLLQVVAEAVEHLVELVELAEAEQEEMLEQPIQVAVVVQMPPLEEMVLQADQESSISVEE